MVSNSSRSIQFGATCAGRDSGRSGINFLGRRLPRVLGKSHGSNRLGIIAALLLVVVSVSGCGAAPTNKVKISFPNLQAGLENQNSGSAELTAAILGSPLTSSYRSPVATVGGTFESSAAVSPSYRVVGGVHIQ